MALDTAQSRWSKKAQKVYTFRLHNVHDADIIDKLDSVENRQGYIKALVRADIEKNAT